jgi:hypothetical protein
MAFAWWIVPCLPFPGLPRDFEFFMFAVMKTFVTDISASTGRNDFIFDIWLLHGELHRVSPFQVYRTSTSYLPCDLDTNGRVGVFLARRSVQHLVSYFSARGERTPSFCLHPLAQMAF